MAFYLARHVGNRKPMKKFLEQAKVLFVLAMQLQMSHISFTKVSLFRLFSTKKIIETLDFDGILGRG